jgi:hypothetical protein
VLTPPVLTRVCVAFQLQHAMHSPTVFATFS